MHLFPKGTSEEVLRAQHLPWVGAMGQGMCYLGSEKGDAVVRVEGRLVPYLFREGSDHMLLHYWMDQPGHYVFTVGDPPLASRDMWLLESQPAPWGVAYWLRGVLKTSHIEIYTTQHLGLSHSPGLQCRLKEQRAAILALRNFQYPYYDISHEKSHESEQNFVVVLLPRRVVAFCDAWGRVRDARHMKE